MTLLEFTFLVALTAFVAGLLGSLTGLGGGVIVVPVLVLFFHVDIRYAVGASLVSVIATSSGSAAAYVREGYSNIRIGMLLEIATTIGAVVGASIAAHVATQIIAVIFAVTLLYSAYHSIHAIEQAVRTPKASPLAVKLKLNGSYPGPDGAPIPYFVENVPVGFTLMLVAGALSGLLGIGSGALKVIAMDRSMRIPFKVSTTTSNFMIGVTAAASAGVYLGRGYIEPGLAMPIMLGVLTGALLGTRLLMRTSVPKLRRVFAIVILLLAMEMIFNAFTNRI